MILKAIHNHALRACHQFSIKATHYPDSLLHFLIFITQLQLASLFAPPVLVSESNIDTIILSVLSFANIFKAWIYAAAAAAAATHTTTPSSSSASILILLLLIYYVLLAALEAVYILIQHRNRHTRFGLTHTLLSSLFVVQRYVLLIPSLCGCLFILMKQEHHHDQASSSAPTSVTASNMALSAMLLVMVLMYNIIHIYLTIHLPYTRGHQLLQPSHAHELADVFYALASVVVSRSITTTTTSIFASSSSSSSSSSPLSASTHQTDSEGRVLMLSLAVIFYVARVVVWMFFPAFESTNTQKVDVVARITPLYAITASLASAMSSSSRLPVLIIHLMLARALISGHDFIARLSLGILKDQCLKIKSTLIVGALNLLFARFYSCDERNNIFITVMEILITDSSRHYSSEFLSQEDKPVNKHCYKKDLHLFLIKYMDRMYRLAIHLQKHQKHKSFHVYISYLQFLVNVRCNHIRALFVLADVRKTLSCQMSSRQSLILDILSHEIASQVKDSKDHGVFSSRVEQALQYLDFYKQSCLTAKSLTHQRATIMSSVMDQVCDLDTLVSRSAQFLKEATALTSQLRLAMCRSDFCHLETAMLYRFVQTAILGDDSGRLDSKYMQGIVGCTREGVDDAKFRDRNEPFGLQTMLNMTRDSACSYVCVALPIESAKYGGGLKVAAVSPNLQDYLELCGERSMVGMDVRELFVGGIPHFLDGISQGVRLAGYESQEKEKEKEKDKNMMTQRWREGYMYGAGGVLFEVTFLVGIEMIKEELFLTVYVMQGMNRTKCIMIDAEGKVVGVSKGLANDLQKRQKELVGIRAGGFLPQYLTAANSSIVHYIPEFQLDTMMEIIAQGKQLSGIFYPYTQPSNNEDPTEQLKFMQFHAVYTVEKQAQDDLIVSSSSSFYSSLSSYHGSYFCKVIIHKMAAIPPILGKNACMTTDFTSPSLNFASFESNITRQKLNEHPKNYDPQEHLKVELLSEPLPDHYQLHSCLSPLQMKTSAATEISCIHSFAYHSENKNVARLYEEKEKALQFNINSFKTSEKFKGCYYSSTVTENVLSHKTKKESLRHLQKHQQVQSNKVKPSRTIQKVTHLHRTKSSLPSCSDNRQKDLRRFIRNKRLPHLISSLNVGGHIKMMMLLVCLISIIFTLHGQLGTYTLLTNYAPFTTNMTAFTTFSGSRLEQIISINNNFYSKAVSIPKIKSLAVVFNARMSLYKWSYFNRVVNYNIENLAPSFRYSDFFNTITRTQVFDQPINASFQLFTNIFFSAALSMNRTSYRMVTSMNDDVIWLRKYGGQLSDTLERMSKALFASFESISSQIMLSLLSFSLTSVVIAICFLVTSIWFFRVTNQEELNTLKFIPTISSRQCCDCLSRLGEQYEEQFGVKLDYHPEIKKTILENVDYDDKGSKSQLQKSSRRNNQRRRFRREKRANYTIISAASLLTFCYIIMFPLVLSLYYKNRLNLAYPFVQNLNFMVQLMSPASRVTSSLFKFMNMCYESQSIDNAYQAKKRIFDSLLAYKKDVINLMYSANVTLLQSPFAGQKLKARYANLRGMNICDDASELPVYPSCLTAYNGVSYQGYAAAYSAYTDFTLQAVSRLVNNCTKDTVASLLTGSGLSDHITMRSLITTIITNNVNIGVDNIAMNIQSFQTSLFYFLVAGIIQLAILVAVFHRFFYTKQMKKLVDARKVYLVLQGELVLENKAIVKMLKK